MCTSFSARPYRSRRMPRGFAKGLVPSNFHRDEKEISLFPSCSFYLLPPCVNSTKEGDAHGGGTTHGGGKRRRTCAVICAYLSTCLSVCPSVRPSVCRSRWYRIRACTYCLCSSRVTYANVIPTRRCWAADSRPRTASPIWLRVVTTAAARPCILHSPRATPGRKIATLPSRRPGRRVAMLPGNASP